MANEMTESDKVKLYKENRKKKRLLEEAFYNGQPLRGAYYFVWGGSLYYGLEPEVKTEHELRGHYIEIASTEGTLNAKDNARALRRICGILNTSHALVPMSERKASA